MLRKVGLNWINLDEVILLGYFILCRYVDEITYYLFYTQAAREQWSETLWANLNIQILQDGIEAFLKNLRKMPRDVRQMPVARSLEEKMKEFRDSLPLFVDLKHEALRDR